jgi:hypothetical protein
MFFVFLLILSMKCLQYLKSGHNCFLAQNSHLPTFRATESIFK